jgi:ribosomal-protein-alanine N-acetyltransferase
MTNDEVHTVLIWCALRWMETNPLQAEWGLFYAAKRGPTPELVGAVGYKGAPSDSGEVEVGYGILTERRRMGFATEATGRLVERAFEDPRVTTVAAHTLPDLVPSIGVLDKLGFRFVRAEADAGEETAIRYELSREGWRAHASLEAG